MTTRRKLFTASLEHVAPHLRDDELDDLARALRDEFPAYWISMWTKADDQAAVIVSTDVRESDFVRLNGWGHGWLTLSEVK